MGMFDWLRGDPVEEGKAAGDLGEEADAKLEDAERSLEEIGQFIEKAEEEAQRTEEKERELREEGERLMMETYDEFLGDLSATARRIVAKEVKTMLADLAKKKEDHELRVLKLELQRAALLGQQRKAQDLLRNLGKVDPLHSVSVGGAADLPPYPNIVETENEDAALVDKATQCPNPLPPASTSLSCDDVEPVE